MNIFTYFKRVKKPIKSLDEAKPIVRETRIYFFIFLALFVVFGILSGLIAKLQTVFTIIAIVAFVPTAYFGIMLYAMKRSMKRFKNLHCECGAELVNDKNTTWQEVSREWRDSADKNRAESTLYVKVKITCICPKCGKSKTFTETLCSGKITVTNYSKKDTIVSTQSLVDDYFAGTIHA